MSWFWKQDLRLKDEGGWESYSEADNKKIEKAYQADVKTIKLSDTHRIDFKAMEQQRIDDPSRRRFIKREEPESKSKKTVKSKKTAAVTSVRKAPAKRTKVEKKEVSASDEEEDDDDDENALQIFAKKWLTGKPEHKFNTAALLYVQSKLSVVLPDGYIELLRARNGGTCEKGFTEINDEEIELMGIAGIHASADCELLSEDENAHEEWEVPKWIIPFSRNDGHVSMCFDYRKPSARKSGKPPIVKVEDGEVTNIAEDFTSFIEALIESYESED